MYKDVRKMFVLVLSNSFINPKLRKSLKFFFDKHTWCGV
jgi:hypothetical protein